jgi:hypothetical protein
MEPALTEKEAMRRWVADWKVAGEELDRIKWEELRAMTEDDAARIFELLSMHPRDGWMRPERFEDSGLVEQQRLFRKFHESASSRRCGV